MDARMLDYGAFPGAMLGYRGGGGGRGRNGIGGVVSSGGGGPTAKVLTHRLLKYLIAQYEPLDVSRYANGNLCCSNNSCGDSAACLLLADQGSSKRVGLTTMAATKSTAVHTTRRQRPRTRDSSSHTRAV